MASTDSEDELEKQRKANIEYIKRTWNISAVGEAPPPAYPWPEDKKPGRSPIHSLRKLAEVCPDLSLARAMMTWAILKRVESKQHLEDGAIMKAPILLEPDIKAVLKVIWEWKGIEEPDQGPGFVTGPAEAEQKEIDWDEVFKELEQKTTGGTRIPKWRREILEDLHRMRRNAKTNYLWMLAKLLQIFPKHRRRLFRISLKKAWKLLKRNTEATDNAFVATLIECGYLQCDWWDESLKIITKDELDIED